MTSPNGDWEDARLGAAFRSRFDAAPPTGLVAIVMSELETRRPTSSLASLRTSTVGLAGIAAIVAAVLVGSQLGIGLPRAGGSAPAPTGPEFSSPPNGAGSEFPRTVVMSGSGYVIPVLSVAEAAFTRDAGVNSTVIAVGGWYVPWQAIPCPMQPDEYQPLEGCYLDSSWLLEAPDQLTRRGPVGDPTPALHPVTDLDTPGDVGRAPVPVVLIGHFDDAGAAKCPAGPRRQACADRFVVEQVAWTVTPLIATFPTTAAGFDVITVGAAISARESDSVSELAVAGWYQMPGPVKDCSSVPEVGVPLLEGGACSAIAHTWLMAAPESLITIAFVPSGGPYAGITTKAPSGPAVNLTFAGIWPPEGTPLPVTGGSTPTPVVFIGHFHDRRAYLCSLDEAAACGRRFVVDAVAWVDGTTREMPVQVDWRDGGKPDQTAAQLDAMSNFLGAHTWILNTRLASSVAVANLEPVLAANSAWQLPAPAALTHDPLLWIATVIETNPGPLAPIARTYIIDSNGVLYADGGPTFIIPGPEPTPS